MKQLRNIGFIFFSLLLLAVSFYLLLIEPNPVIVEEMTCKPDMLDDAVAMLKDSLSFVIRSN